jgi:acyl-CoA reductase-like NAD-dependent aldehyde dehydrogenase
VVQAVQQAVPTIQVQPQVQKMPVMVLDQATGQYVQQMVDMVLDPATGNYVPAPVATDPKALAEQQKAAAAAAKEAERKAREQEAAERRARNDQLREEAAERARRNDSVAGRVKNTAISTATRQVVSSLTRNVTKAIESLFGGKKR